MEEGVFWLELPAHFMHASRFPVDCPISYQHEEGRVIRVWILLEPDDSGMLLSQSSSQRSDTADYQLRHDIIIKTRQGNTILHEKIPSHQLQFPLKCPVSVASSLFCNYNNNDDDGQSTNMEWIDGTILLQLEEENETENEHDNSDGVIVTQYCVRLAPTTVGAKPKRLNGVPLEALRYRPLENAVTNTEKNELTQQQQLETMDEGVTKPCSLDETKKGKVMTRHGENTIRIQEQVIHKNMSTNNYNTNCNNETQRNSLDETTVQKEHKKASATRLMQNNREVDLISYPISPDSRKANNDSKFTRSIDVLPVENIRMTSLSPQSSTTWIKDEFVEKETQHDENVTIHHDDDESSRETSTNIKIEVSSSANSTTGEQEESERMSSEHYDRLDSSNPSPRKRAKLSHKLRPAAHNFKDNDGPSSLEVKRETLHAIANPSAHIDTFHIGITAASNMPDEKCTPSRDDTSIATTPDILCDSNVDAGQSLDIKQEAQRVTAELDIAMHTKYSIAADNTMSKETRASHEGDASIADVSYKRDSSVDAKQDVKPSLEATQHTTLNPSTYMNTMHMAATSETSEICASRRAEKDIESKLRERDSNIDAGSSLEIKREFQHAAIFEPDTDMDINGKISTNDKSHETDTSHGGKMLSIHTIHYTQDSSVDARQSLDIKREAQQAAIEAPMDIHTSTVTSEIPVGLLDFHEGDASFISELSREIQDEGHSVQASSVTPVLDNKHVPIKWLDRNVATETESKVDRPLKSSRIPRKPPLSQSAQHQSSHLLNNLSGELHTENLELPPWLRSTLIEKIIFARDKGLGVFFQDLSKINTRQCDFKISATKGCRKGGGWTTLMATHESVDIARAAIEDVKQMLFMTLSGDGGFRLFYELTLYKQQEDKRIFRWKGTILRTNNTYPRCRGAYSSHKMNWRTTPPKHGTPTSFQRKGRTFHWCSYCSHYSTTHSSDMHSQEMLFMTHVRLPSYYVPADFIGFQEDVRRVTGAKVRLVGQRDTPPRPYALLSGPAIDSVEQAVPMVESFFTRKNK